MLDDTLQRNNLAMMHFDIGYLQGCHRADASSRLSMYMQVQDLNHLAFQLRWLFYDFGLL